MNRTRRDKKAPSGARPEGAKVMNDQAPRGRGETNTTALTTARERGAGEAIDLAREGLISGGNKSDYDAFVKRDLTPTPATSQRPGNRLIRCSNASPVVWSSTRGDQGSGWESRVIVAFRRRDSGQFTLTCEAISSNLAGSIPGMVACSSR